MKVGVYADINNLYKTTKLEHSKKLDYEKYLDFVKTFGDVTLAKAYGAQVNSEGDKFIAYLEKIGFDVTYRKVDVIDINGRKAKIPPIWDCQITMEVLADADELDYIFLGVSSKNFLPLVNYLLEQKSKKVMMFSSRVDEELKAITTHFDVTTSMLEK